MNYRNSVIALVAAVIVFIALNYFIWACFTEKLFTKNYGAGGDLSRNGYIVDSRQPRQAIVDLPNKHLAFRDYKDQPVDMINIGDSFAHGGGEGKNGYYPDYIATNSKITVLNLSIYNTAKGPIDTVLVLLNSGLLDKINPKYILIESIERYCLTRFAGEINFNATEDQAKLVKHYKNVVVDFNYLPKTGFINSGNIQYLFYRFLYLFTDSPTKLVVTKKLSKPLFNVKNNDRLLYFRDDTKDLMNYNKQMVINLNNNMNKLAVILAKKGIKLCFMPIVDKYNLYSEFIINNPYPKSVFFEELRALPKNYQFIDTKEILLEAVRRGEKDIYYADDTHWSWRAPELIFDRVRFEKVLL